jgi:hypothetical protein
MDLSGILAGGVSAVTGLLSQLVSGILSFL